MPCSDHEVADLVLVLLDVLQVVVVAAQVGRHVVAHEHGTKLLYQVLRGTMLCHRPHWRERRREKQRDLLKWGRSQWYIICIRSMNNITTDGAIIVKIRTTYGSQKWSTPGQLLVR